MKIDEIFMKLEVGATNSFYKMGAVASVDGAELALRSNPSETRASFNHRARLRQPHTGTTALFASVNEVGLFHLADSNTAMGGTHLRDYSRRCTFRAVRSAPYVPLISPKQPAALICIVGQKTRKPEVAGPLLRLHCLFGMFTILTSELH